MASTAHDRVVSPTEDLNQSVHPGWVEVAAWQDLPWLRACFSTRSAPLVAPGTAGMAEDEFVQDFGRDATKDLSAVDEGRRNLLRRISNSGKTSLHTLNQVHGTDIHEVLSCAGTTESVPGDGMITRQADQYLGIFTADCVPVLLADKRTHAVGAFHAGWRGTLGEVVKLGVSRMQDAFGSHPEELTAAIGPAIRTCCFQVGPGVVEDFHQKFRYAADLVVSKLPASGQEAFYLDLQLANRRQLVDAGLKKDQVHTVQQCTSCSRDRNGRRRYFSYRAEGGVTGRMLSLIGSVNL